MTIQNVQDDGYTHTHTHTKTAEGKFLNGRTGAFKFVIHELYG